MPKIGNSAGATVSPNTTFATTQCEEVLGHASNQITAAVFHRSIRINANALRRCYPIINPSNFRLTTILVGHINLHPLVSSSCKLGCEHTFGGGEFVTPLFTGLPGYNKSIGQVCVNISNLPLQREVDAYCYIICGTRIKRKFNLWPDVCHIHLDNRRQINIFKCLTVFVNISCYNFSIQLKTALIGKRVYSTIQLINDNLLGYFAGIENYLIGSNIKDSIQTNSLAIKFNNNLFCSRS